MNILIQILVEQAYTFTVQTINDAAESNRVSDPSSAVICKTKHGGRIVFWVYFRTLEVKWNPV